MFQWSTESGNIVVSRDIWIYWAFTIPLTAITFLSWTFWLRYREKEQPKEGKQSHTLDRTDSQGRDAMEVRDVANFSMGAR